MVAFLYSMIAELVGLSAIIGSFLAGVSLAGINLRHGAVFRDGAEHLQIIFASIFFISLGVLLDLHIITSSLLWFILALTAVSMIVALIGLSQGLIEQDTYAALILMSLLTTIIPPVVLRNWLFRKGTTRVRETA